MIRTGKDEALHPKYAHIERERRWLVDPSTRPTPADPSHALIHDHYLMGTRLRLRQMADSRSGNKVHKLTKKYPAQDPLARAIVTAYLTDDEYELFATLPAHIISKRRYQLQWDDLTFSLDLFDGPLAPLELLEIEWPDDSGLQKLISPSWTLREVSHDLQYQGATLAAHGKPKE